MKREKYDNFEKTFTIGNVSVGGDFGEIPTVLIGSIFYMRHKIVKDAEKGIFDEALAARLINDCIALSEKVGAGFMLDVVGNTAEAFVNYVCFIRSITDTPILLNATMPETRIDALQRISDLGCNQNIIYNSINAFSTDDELLRLSQMKIEAAIVQAYNPGSKKATGPYQALIGTDDKEGLLEKAEKADVKKIMIDIPTLDLSSIGLIARSAQIIKDNLGIPVGTAPSNATYASALLRDRTQFSKEQFQALDATVNSYLASRGFNFIFFGPIEGYKWTMPASALVNGISVYAMRSEGVKPLTQTHPIFKML